MAKLIPESGLYFDPPSSRWFRWQDLPAFKSLKGLGVAEMDFGWCDPSGHHIWLMELKDYTRLSAREKLPEYLDAEFIQKATDCLIMMASVWYNLPHGARLQPELPPEFCVAPTKGNQLRLAFVLKITEKNHIAAIAPLLDKLKNKIKARCELFGIKAYTQVILLDHTTAISGGLPLVDVASA